MTFHTRGAWSSVNLGWKDGEFVGWYVNFEVPYEETQYGLETMDLVLDLLIDPEGNPQVKDEDDYAAAVERGILDGHPDLEEEQVRVLREVLPPGLRAGGDAWAISPRTP